LLTHDVAPGLQEAFQTLIFVTKLRKRKCMTKRKIAKRVVITRAQLDKLIEEARSTATTRTNRRVASST